MIGNTSRIGQLIANIMEVGWTVTRIHYNVMCSTYHVTAEDRTSEITASATEQCLASALNTLWCHIQESK